MRRMRTNLWRLALAAALLTVITLGVAAADQAPEGSEETAMKTWQAFQLEDLETRRAERGRPWLSFLEVPDMEAGLYELPAGGEDRQTPHKADELYYVIRGKAVLSVAGEEQAVSAGSVIYVAKHVEHHFHSIEEDLEVLVVFAGNE